MHRVDGACDMLLIAKNLEETQVMQSYAFYIKEKQPM